MLPYNLEGLVVTFVCRAIRKDCQELQKYRLELDVAFGELQPLLLFQKIGARLLLSAVGPIMFQVELFLTLCLQTATSTLLYYNVVIIGDLL